MRIDIAVERMSPLVKVLSTWIRFAAVPKKVVKRAGSATTPVDKPFARIALRTFRWFSARWSSVGGRSRTYFRAASPERLRVPTGNVLKAVRFVTVTPPRSWVSLTKPWKSIMTTWSILVSLRFSSVRTTNGGPPSSRAVLIFSMPRPGTGTKVVRGMEITYA
jgi:hypothetical protein